MGNFSTHFRSNAHYCRIIGSASAKWGILAPIFVPMLIIVGFHPAFTQVIYRVGDSITNPITPMMPSRWTDSIVWTVFVILWFLLGIPVGPGGPIFVK